MAAEKDTIYIDIDDEITGIVEKLRESSGKIVALVLPKRAAVLQSIVNMKLLKRAADDSKKNFVLITSEAGLLPLAGAVGVHVAKTLTSKPEIPTPPQTDDGREETVNETDADDGETPDFSKEAVAAKPVGELAGLAATDEVETLELDDDEPEAATEDNADATPAAAAAAAKLKKDKKLHVPNFDRFRWALVLAVLLIPLLIFGLYYALAVAPKATIAIDTNAVNVNSSLNLTLDTGAKKLDTDKHIVPAKLAQQQKTYSQQASATGSKNNGTKASGVVTLSAKNCTSIAPAADVPAGTGVSSNGLTYITQKSTSFSATSVKNGCIYFQSNADTTVIAQTGGANYNTNDNASFAVAGRPDVSGVANGAISGGSDNITKIVSQTDIDTAKAKITTQDSTVKQVLANQLQQDGYFAVKPTFNSGTPVVTTSANAGDAADSVTVTEVVTYVMFGAKKADLTKLVDDAVATQIDTAKQTIISEGLDTASFSVDSADDKTAKLTLQTVATAGPDLNIAEIKSFVAGQKSGFVKQQLGNRPGVTGVNVKLSPFWVSSIPKKQTKITVTISKPTAPTKTTNGNSN